MLFSFRPILAVAMLAGLIPLAVVGAPLSQVEGDIVRRVIEGDKFTVGKHKLTLGEKVAEGSTASVHEVNNRPKIVAKVFKKDGGVSPKDMIQEVNNLRKVGEFEGKTETKDGHHIILATKKPGKKITKTKAWKNAGSEEDKKKVLDKAKTLTEERNTHHAKEHGIVHTDTNHGNVLFEENKKGLESAHFVDWGLAKPAEKDKKGDLKEKTKTVIRRSGTKVVHGVSR